MRYQYALETAEKIKILLEPHCERIEIAGSIRRKRPVVGDIEIVAIPKPYNVGLFKSGIALVVDEWEKVKGELPCKYTQRILPEGIKLDLFFAYKENWGLTFAVRTGSAEYSHRVLATNWVKNGYKSRGGFLYRGNTKIMVYEERNLFSMIGVKWIEPEFREYYD